MGADSTTAIIRPIGGDFYGEESGDCSVEADYLESYQSAGHLLVVGKLLVSIDVLEVCKKINQMLQGPVIKTANMTEITKGFGQLDY